MTTGDMLLLFGLLAFSAGGAACWLNANLAERHSFHRRIRAATRRTSRVTTAK